MEEMIPEKSPLLLWAENEVKLACKHENSDWNGESFDYGCACYQSALKAFSSLCSEGHTIYSWFETIHILERLCYRLPLTPITINDFGYIKGVTPEMIDPDTGATLALCRIETPPSWEGDDGTRYYSCSRCSSLYMNVKPDYSYSFSDTDRTTCINIECFDDTYKNGLISDIVNEMYPITLPYYPSKNKYKVYTRTFLTDPSLGDFDTKEIVYIVKPDGEKVPVNRYFHEFKNVGFREISKDEYDELVKKRIDTQERKIAYNIANNVVDDIFDHGANAWRTVLGFKWNTHDVDDEIYEKDKSYNYCEIWWAFMRQTYKNDSSDELMNKLEKSISGCDILKTELCGWGAYHRISRLDTDLLNKYPQLQDVYNATHEIIKWTGDQYADAWTKTNDYIKELNSIDDDEKRVARRKEIIKEITK